MNKKIIGVCVGTLLIVTMFPMSGTAAYDKYKVYNIAINDPYEMNTVDYIGNGETLDQYQTKTYSVNIGVCSFQWVAQSFKPTVMTLTRVELYIYKYLNPPVDTIITVSIRDSLDGNDLTSIDFVTGEFFPSQQWVEFDFPDLQVVPEQIYYIVTRGDYCEEDGGYMWTTGMYNPYDRGDAWWWDEYQGWEKIDYDELPECDTAFKTYGLNEAPDIPTIDGPTDGKVDIEYNYNISTTDYEGYDIWYYIEWGDGDTEKWIGPYESGENVTVSHKWNKKKTYEIRVKAKDIHDFESDWATLKVTMPKNKPAYFNFNLLSWLFERFPNMFPILRYILGL
ncbi:MAG: PKD domain-containing protein [Thermoplasmatales archaeon]|nr:MAG: PKD domain-containing protein [Thermoplasmatales archaeon]